MTFAITLLKMIFIVTPFKRERPGVWLRIALARIPYGKFCSSKLVAIHRSKVRYVELKSRFMMFHISCIANFSLRPQYQIPGLAMDVWNTSYTYKYFGEKTPKLSRAYRNQPFFPNGKMLGGTSSMNAMLYVRVTSDDFNAWNVKGWKYDDVLPYFLKSEGNKKKAKGKYHNNEGNWTHLR